MTWLLLPGDQSTELLAQMASARRAMPAHAQPNDWVVMATVEQSRQVLRDLPAALGTTPICWPDELGEGFHPLTLTTPEGPLDVLLCAGDVRESLSECVSLVEQVWLGPISIPASDAKQAGSRPLASLISRLCGKGTRVSHLPGAEMDHADWLAAGFVPASAHQDAHHPTTAAAAASWQYAPRWPAPDLTARAGTETQHAPTAIVIGAGFAGAATALCLIRKGWQVELIDQYAAPALGASALPTGLLSEHVTARDTLMAELSRVGMPLQRRELAEHVPAGAGWQATTVVNLKGTASEDDDATPVCGGHSPLVLPAVVVRGSALVQAWLDLARASGRLREHWSTHVAQLQREGGLGTSHDHHQASLPGLYWAALDEHGRVIARAEQVVLAAAYGSHALMLPHAGGVTTEGPLRPVKGQMSMAPLHGEPFGHQAIRQHGVFVPAYQDSGHPVGPQVWAMGSTYERGHNNADITPESQARNAASLAAMHPAAHARMQQQMQQGEMVEWAQVRCASLDRLPLVGPLPTRAPLAPSTQLDAVPREPGLWSYCALGSRGLTLGMLAAQLLVARMTHGTWPVKKRHGLAMDPARFALKLARKADRATRGA